MTSISKNQVTVSTAHYQRAAGKQPRGKGNWAFSIGESIIFFNGSYTEAKKKAIELAAKRGNHTIFVEF